MSSGIAAPFSLPGNKRMSKSIIKLSHSKNKPSFLFLISLALILHVYCTLKISSVWQNFVVCIKTGEKLVKNFLTKQIIADVHEVRHLIILLFSVTNILLVVNSFYYKFDNSIMFLKLFLISCYNFH